MTLSKSSEPAVLFLIVTTGEAMKICQSPIETTPLLSKT